MIVLSLKFQHHCPGLQGTVNFKVVLEEGDFTSKCGVHSLKFFLATPLILCFINSHPKNCFERCSLYRTKMALLLGNKGVP